MLHLSDNRNKVLHVHRLTILATAHVIQKGTIFPCDIRGVKDTLNNFRYAPFNGITNWVMPFGNGKTQYLGLYPTSNNAGLTTTLTKDLSETDTTVQVASTNGFIARNGRFTVGEEKFLYQYKDSTAFYGCIRGMEMTQAAQHKMNTEMRENNLWLFYSRRNEKYTVLDNDFVEQSVLSKEIDVVEEHMEGVIKAVSYNLILKIDPERASAYKVDSESLYQQYKDDLKKGYGKRSHQNMRGLFPFSESGLPNATNMMY
jgi:hypothetical protein